jgi:hypothetical protein
MINHWFQCISGHFSNFEALVYQKLNNFPSIINRRVPFAHAVYMECEKLNIQSAKDYMERIASINDFFPPVLYRDMEIWTFSFRIAELALLLNASNRDLPSVKFASDQLVKHSRRMTNMFNTPFGPNPIALFVFHMSIRWATFAFIFEHQKSHTLRNTVGILHDPWCWKEGQKTVRFWIKAASGWVDRVQAAATPAVLVMLKGANKFIAQDFLGAIQVWKEAYQMLSISKLQHQRQLLELRILAASCLNLQKFAKTPAPHKKLFQKIRKASLTAGKIGVLYDSQPMVNSIKKSISEISEWDEMCNFESFLLNSLLDIITCS